MNNLQIKNVNETILNTKFLTIDIARGFAALSVFIYHYGVGTVLEKATGWSGFNRLSLPGALFAVPLFFLISGFCIHWSQLRQEARQRIHQDTRTLNYLTYFKRRFWRIYPTYLVALLFSCGIQAVEGQKINILDFFLHLFLLQGFSVESFNSLNLVLWTISVEALFYLMYPLWYNLRNRLGINLSLGIGLFVSLTSWLICAVYLYPYSMPQQWFVLNLWGAWLTGAWLAEQVIYHKQLFNHFGWWLTGIGSIFVVGILQNSGIFSGRGEIIRASVLTILWIFPLSAMLLAEKWLTNFARQGLGNITVKSIQLCGQFSYSLYLLHMPLMYLRNALWADMASGSLLRIAIWGMGFPAILVVSWIFYQLFEKPFIQYRI